jgi:hypothetical protein
MCFQVVIGATLEKGQWQAKYIFFARAGFAVAAQALAEEQGAWLVTLAQLDGVYLPGCLLKPSTWMVG